MRLNYQWHARHENGSYVHQYDESGNEHLFSEIDQTQLSFFYITGNHKLFGVDFLQKTMWIGSDASDYYPRIPEQSKLIYFRRNQANTNGVINIRHIIGFQERNTSNKIMLAINDKTNELEWVFD